MSNNSSGSIHTRTTELWVNGDTEETKVTELLEKTSVELLLLVVLLSLWLDLSLDKGAEHLTKRGVLRGRVEDIELWSSGESASKGGAGRSKSKTT